MFVPFGVRDFLDRAAAAYGARPGIVDEIDQPAQPLGTLTYARVAELARAQAAGLDALGIDPGARVAVVSHNSGRLLASFFGVAGYGRVLVPINHRLTEGEVNHIVDHSGAELLLIDPELADRLASVPCKRRLIFGADSDDELYRFGVEPAQWTPDELAPATINYTSGTTGRPKGVTLTHRNIWVNAVTFALHVGVSDRDAYLHTLPMFHVNGWGMPFALAGAGATQVVLRKVDGVEILNRVAEHGITLMCAAPAVVNTVLAAAKDWDGQIPGRGRTRIVVAGAPPSTRTIERVETELGWEFIQLYGLTETSPVLTINRCRSEWDGLPAAERAVRLASAGPPALGVTLRTDAAGEVLARANTVLDSYWHQPEATEAALAGGWFHTGDGGAITDDGYLVITDRKKDVIVTGGENVSSIEVEDVLYTHPAVADVAVIGVPDERWGETVKALVVLADGSALAGEELIRYCKQRLAGYKAPTSIEFRPSLPRTATGKLQKRALREPYWAGRDRQVN